MRYLYKIIRITAWLLVLAALLTLFSGFFTTKYFLAPWIGYKFVRNFHAIVIPLIFIPLFYLHSLAGLWIMMTRHVSLNKKTLKIIMSIIWTAILVLFIWFYLAQNSSQTITNTNTANTNTSKTSDLVNVTLNIAEISKHNSASDCWLIISNKVYEVTRYLNSHPGSPSTITPYCGKDGTNAFATKDIGVPHSSTASNLLNNYLLGNVGDTINAQKLQDIQAQTQNSGSEEEEDD